MTLALSTETMVELYLTEQMTEQQIASRLGCSQQTVNARLKKAGAWVPRSNKKHLYRLLTPHLPVLVAMVREMRTRRRALAEFVVDPRNPDTERVAKSAALVALNKQITALEIVVRK